MDNIYISRSSEEGQLYLSFGEEETEIIGSPEGMHPDPIKGRFIEISKNLFPDIKMGECLAFQLMKRDSIIETGIKRIARERTRLGQLATAAASYVLWEYERKIAENLWPFDKKWFKPSNHNTIRNLEKAGALIAADIDRRLHEEFIDEKNKQFRKVFDEFGKTHIIEEKPGTTVNLEELKDNQSVIWGDGKTYYWLLTEEGRPA
jgi:hypothetical protein